MLESKTCLYKKECLQSVRESSLLPVACFIRRKNRISEWRFFYPQVINKHLPYVQ